MIRCIDFSAEWCGPCKAYAPIFTEVSEMDDYKDKVSFERVNVDDTTDEEDELISNLRVRNIPLTAIIDGEGNVLKKIVGAVGKTELIETLNDLIE